VEQPSAPAASPHVTVGRDFVSLDGERVDAVPSPAKAQRLDTLFAKLRDRRSATPGPHEIWIDLPAETPPWMLMSAVMTSAFAGFARQHIRAGGTWLAVTMLLPGPFKEQQPDVTRITLDVRGPGARVSWQSSRPCADVPADADVTLADLPSYFDGRCAGTSDCFQRITVGLASAASSADALAALAAASAHGARPDSPVVFALNSGPTRSCGEPLPSEAMGRIAPEKIQQIVRANFGAFRVCYEQGLAGNPKLQGKVTVKFVIERDGTVSAATDAGSDLPDPAVVACIVKGYETLKFPKPDGGRVTVVYPIMFNPGD
jgi:hypothetical protein